MALLGAGCGSEEPKSAASEQQLKAAVKDAPTPLAKLYAEGDKLLDGGAKAYTKQIAALRGYPVVANKWASWCGPCRREFPFFQEAVKEHGKEIAFLGIDGQDNRERAREFLDEFPVPYPSFFDPDDDISDEIGSTIGFPTTTFYDKFGSLVYTKPGGYASTAALEKDLEQYAGSGPPAKPPKQVEPSDLQ